MWLRNPIKNATYLLQEISGEMVVEIKKHLLILCKGREANILFVVPP